MVTSELVRVAPVYPKPCTLQEASLGPGLSNNKEKRRDITAFSKYIKISYNHIEDSYK